MADRPEIELAFIRACQALLAERMGEHWEGELSPSALSTAVSVAALSLVDPAGHRERIERGLEWISQHQNADGGWGDTPISHSNIATTCLVLAAFRLSQAFHESSVAAGREYLAKQCGGLDPDHIVAALDARYGRDRSFSAPILSLLALAGMLGEGRSAWQCVAALPFELGVLPHRLLRWVRLPVVSYALPALIAIGQLRFQKAPPRCPLTWLVRRLSRRPTLRKLERIQPESGGFLEASPLTAFVTASLAGMGLADHPVARRGVEFLVSTQRPEGSWAIDVNLATWVTTLSVNALPDDLLCGTAASAVHDTQAGKPVLSPTDTAGAAVPHEAAAALAATLDWLLAQQHRRVHPYTGARPGGWAWTNLSGGVPDADDTAGALLAVAKLSRLAGREDDPAVLDSAAAAINWLMEIQNSDGGVPTFCRGWGTLPFDRSSPDLTAHALLAWSAWRDRLPRLCPRLDRATARAIGYLALAQQPDGSWRPLWFGNQDSPGQANPVYGTARVLIALAALGSDTEGVSYSHRRKAVGSCDFAKDNLTPRAQEPPANGGGYMLFRGRAFLLSCQNPDGGFGASAGVASSIEETAVALDALSRLDSVPADALSKALDWLLLSTDSCRRFPPTPIGLYFASLWYYEKLYPLTFTVSALRHNNEA